MLSGITSEHEHDELRLDPDPIVGEGARRVLAAALEAEVDQYLAAHADERDPMAGGWWSAMATLASAR